MNVLLKINFPFCFHFFFFFLNYQNISNFETFRNVNVFYKFSKVQSQRSGEISQGSRSFQNCLTFSKSKSFSKSRNVAALMYPGYDQGFC